MGTKSIVAIAVVALIGLFALPLWAQGPWGGYGYGPMMMGPGGGYNYENAKKTTVTGEVEELSAPFLTLKSGKETLTVFAGPMHAWFDESFAVSKGDKVKVEAAELPGRWGKRLVAYKINNLTAKKELELRNEDGYPNFRGKGFARRGYRGRGWGHHMGYGPMGYGPMGGPMGYGPGGYNCPNWN